MIFGHLAASILQHRYLKVDLAPVVVAGLFPDIVDKTLCYVLGVTSSGRMAAHTLLGLGFSSLLVGWVCGRRTGWSWAAGYLGHLLGDMGGVVPWLYPFVMYDFPISSVDLWKAISQFLSNPFKPQFFLLTSSKLIPDIVLTTWLLVVLGWPRKADIGEWILKHRSTQSKKHVWVPNDSRL